MDFRLVLPSLAAFAVAGCFSPSDEVIDPADTDTDAGTSAASETMTETMSSGGSTSGTPGARQPGRPRRRALPSGFDGGAASWPGHADFDVRGLSRE